MIRYFVSTCYLFLLMYFDPNDHTVSYKPIPVSARSRVCLFSCVLVLAPVPTLVRACSRSRTCLFPLSRAPVPALTRACSRSRARLFPLSCAPVPALVRACSRSRARLFPLSCAPIPALVRAHSRSHARLFLLSRAPARSHAHSRATQYGLQKEMLFFYLQCNPIPLRVR